MSTAAWCVFIAAIIAIIWYEVSDSATSSDSSDSRSTGIIHNIFETNGSLSQILASSSVDMTAWSGFTDPLNTVFAGDP